MPLTPPAGGAAVGKLVYDLTLRLLIERRYKQPQIVPWSVEDAVFVVGLPRTGTTAMVGMMAPDGTMLTSLVLRVSCQDTRAAALEAPAGPMAARPPRALVPAA